MAITNSQKGTPLVPQFASGSHLDDAGTPAAATITLGFMPRYIRVVNETTRVQTEWFDGMAATITLKIAADGTATRDTNSLIVVTPVTQVKANADDPDADDFFASFTIAAASIAQNDQIRWQAWA